MKKIIIALMLALALLLSACGSGKSDSQSVPEPIQATEEPSSEPAAEGSAEADGDALVKLGAVNGSTYTNDFLGYGCTLDGWIYATQDEIAELNDIVIDSASTEELQETLRNSNSIMDMYAIREDGMANVNVNFQNVNVLFGRLLTEEAYRDQAYPQMQSGLEGMGMTNVQVEKIDVMIDGAAHPGLLVTGESNGLQLFQRQACVKCSGYIACITVTTFGEDATESVYDLFYHL